MGQSPDQLSQSAVAFPLAFILLNLVLFTPLFGCHLSLTDGLILHFVSFIVLGLAFEIPEQVLTGFCLARSADIIQRAEGMHGPVSGGCVVLPVLMVLVKHFSRAEFLSN